MNPQPTIFVSSIISEFYDLRGALHYFLSKSGFRVLMSEEVDFGADCNKDSLDNCKLLIEQADYYMLLVGNKPGTIFEIDSKRTTVTFEEFRHFIRLRNTGRHINLIAFVRADTWSNYDNNDISRIDQLQIDLIKELVENTLFDEKKIGRWRYTFERFSDIINVLETNQNGLFLEATRKTALYRTYIKREVSDIYKSFVERRNSGEIQAITELCDLPEMEHLDYLTRSKIPSQYAAYISVFCVSMSYKKTLLRKINRVFNYIAQGEFSRFDPKEEKYILPEYIKLTIQTLEILERIFDNAKGSSVFTELQKRDTHNFYINRFEYNLVKFAYDDLKLALLKLGNMVRCLFEGWYDFEKRPDEYYSYRGGLVNMISDDELLEFAKSKVIKK